MGWGVHDYPSPPEQRMPYCPVCGSECDRVYRALNHEILGCDNCISEQDAYEWLDELEEMEEEYRDE